MLTFASFMESLDGPAMELGSLKRVEPRLGSLSSFKHSASSKVARILGYNSINDIPANVRGMSFNQFHLKFSGHYKGKFRGRGTYMTHMAMDWKALKSGL